MHYADTFELNVYRAVTTNLIKCVTTLNEMYLFLLNYAIEWYMNC